ncbi:hypothetical protein DSM104443_00638 [Usitatibacter rugosus]|uniref:DUF3144 domain-containing protein n=1 Tax=Usitatibacter rugosus TaxID=2732067 RepID=A0A6M4GQG7_9PROT|nr:DUF3144 domain-containing protein [Usitatibacter rugosus]QJR09589.1 hypothetical protein DSM104443_00638 [Usitatibacter rugosus]
MTTERSSNISQDDQVFFDLVTRFINEANKMNDEKHHRSRVSAALLFAAARYNAFTWMHRGDDNNPGQTADEAEKFFAAHYRSMFLENVEFLKARAD